ncbi:potassium transporter TrkG [Nonomuraea rubra]|uniref:potassium transporter TrkG n=1 Tax=Nonomuraea rubra TaxID=46180 RepID=UPI0033D1BE6F
MTLVLLALGTLAFLATEWRNPATLGKVDDPGKLLAAFFAAVMPRTAGFNSLDIAQMHPTSLLATDVLMLIGGGTAGTAGGIKITTFGLLAFIIWAEMRGEPRVNIGHRRLADSDLEASILTASLLVELKIDDIWAKAISRQHGQILDRIGVQHVVYPEPDMGERVAHLVSGRLLDYMEVPRPDTEHPRRIPDAPPTMASGPSAFANSTNASVIKRPARRRRSRPPSAGDRTDRADDVARRWRTRRSG